MLGIDEIKRLQDEMVSWRRDLHAHPELGFAESRTSTFIQERLQSFAVDEIHTFTGTGVVAVIHGRDGDRQSVCARISMRCPFRKSPAYPTLQPIRASCMPADMTATPPCCSAQPSTSPPAENSKARPT